MSLADILTPEILGIIVAIIVPFSIALYRLGVLNTKLQSFDEDIKELQKEVKDISIKFNTHLLATKELSKLDTGENKK